MQLEKYLDSTYLKTPEQAGITEAETWREVEKLVQEAVDYQFFAVMIRPDYVAKVKQMISQQSASVTLGTVIGFHEGTYSTQEKLEEAQKAIDDGADELDFVINYTEFKAGNWDKVKEEIIKCNELVISQGKVIKWIIEAAALTDSQIAEITQLIAELSHQFHPEKIKQIFVKSSTGFFKTTGGKPNGATVQNIKIMLENAQGLPVKAAGGVRNTHDAQMMVEMGVERIGTSSARAITQGQSAKGDY